MKKIKGKKGKNLRNKTFNGEALTNLIITRAKRQGVLKYIIRNEIRKLLKITKNTLCYWESGYFRPSLKNLYKLKNYFGLDSFEELL